MQYLQYVPDVLTVVWAVASFVARCSYFSDATRERAAHIGTASKAFQTKLADKGGAS